MPVTADADTRIIDIDIAPTDGIVTVDVQEDLYEPLKDAWHSTPALQKMKFPFRTFGDPIGTEKIGPYVFFDNLSGWRLRPYDDDHELIVVGNLIPESRVQGINRPTWLKRTGRTIVLPAERSAQALSVAPDTSAIAASVWAEPVRTVTGVEDMSEVKQYTSNDGVIVGTQLIFYETDGVTPSITFNLYDKDGNPTGDPTQVYERRRV